MSMRWSGCATDKGLRFVYGANGKTTAMSNGIMGNSHRLELRWNLMRRTRKWMK